MSENEIESTTESTDTAAPEAAPKKKCSRVKWVVASVLLVIIIITGVLYLLEKEGRSSTSFFSTIIEKQEAKKVVAIVNSEEVTNAELKTSIEQFTQMAGSQGVDTTSPEVQTEIREQALQVLINTTLLKQEAAAQNISVTDEEVEARLATLREQIGGEEVLAERMQSLGIDNDRLQKDVKDELTIQKLLDGVFEKANITVSEEEITSVYEGAGGEAAGNPALEEVRPQVEAQIIASKEQAAIDEYLSTLKEKAVIEEKE